MAAKRLVRGQATMPDLSAALDELGVKPGEVFFIATTADEAHARRTDPDTSRAAAASVGDLRESQQAVLTVFERIRKALTDEQLVAHYEKLDLPRQSESGIRTRRRELADAGLLVDSGDKEQMESGRWAILWAMPVRAEPEPVSLF